MIAEQNPRVPGDEFDGMWIDFAADERGQFVDGQGNHPAKVFAIVPDRFTFGMGKREGKSGECDPATSNAPLRQCVATNSKFTNTWISDFCCAKRISACQVSRGAAIRQERVCKISDLSG